MSGDGQSGTTTTVQSNAPWAGQSPFLEKGFQRAESDILNSPQSYYPNSTVVGFSPQTEQALNLAEQRATSGSPLLQAGQQAVQQTASGGFLGPNPYLDQAYEAASRPVINQYMDSVMPGVNATFSQAGRYGSGQHQRAVDMAQENLAQSLADLSGKMAYQNYGDERARQMAAAALSPDLANADYTDIGQLQNVGGVREAQAGAELQDDINRYNFGQQEARDRLAQYMALVGGGSFGGTSSATSPVYRNQLAEGLGTAATATGILGNLFGAGGIFA